MGKLEKLRAALSDALSKMEALDGLTVNEKGEVRSFSEDESKQYDALKSQVSEIRSAIAREEELEANREELRKLNALAGETPKIQVIRNERHNEQGEYRGFGEFNKGGFGDFLQAVQRSSSPSAREDKRLAELRAALGANEQVGTEGGFLVQTDHAEMLFDTAKDAGKLASRCTTVPMKSNTTTINMLDETSLAVGSQFGGVRAYWRQEAGSVTATKPKFRRTNVSLEVLEAVFYATDEQLEDAGQLEAFASKAFATSMAWQLDDAILNGNGAGKPLGVLNSPCTIIIAKEGSQAADTVNFQNINKMYDRLLVGSEDKATWYVHANVRSQLRNAVFTPGSLTDFAVYLPSGGISGKPYDTIFGLGVEPLQQCKALGDLGDIVLGDFSQYVLFRKGGIKAAQSMHVAFLTSEMCFKWSLRANGMPLLNSPITDANGSTTRSPFIVLAERA